MSNDDTRINSLFERFGNNPSAEQTGRWQAMGGKVPYQAAEVMPGPGVARSLQIYFSNGNVAIIRYSGISAVLYTASSEEVSIISRSGAIVMKGTGLLSLMDEIDRERVKTLRFFNPEGHEPAPEGKPIITSITWYTAKIAQERAAGQ